MNPIPDPESHGAAPRQPEAGKEPPQQLRADLGLFDFTLLVIGAIIGDGIYVVGAMGARTLGPAQVVAWLVAGILAALIGLAFVQCAAIDHEAGGSYSYARTAFGPLAGFMAGWTLYVGEWVALSVFPIAFVNYFEALGIDLSSAAELAMKLLLIGAVSWVNWAGIRQGARTNDALTLTKLLPLACLLAVAVVFVIARSGHAAEHLTPFAPLGWSGFGSAILPVFWAYAGFELAVLPAAEVRSPGRNLPLGLIIGMSVATLLYLLTSIAVVVAVPWQDAAASAHPLGAVMEAMLRDLSGPSALGLRLISAGALVSIAGVFVVFTLSLARLSYALASDGFFPSAFAKLHPRHGSPYVGILFQSLCAAVFSTLFDIRGLLTTAVLFLSLCYIATALSALRLVHRFPEQALHLPALKPLLLLGALSAVYLAAQASLNQIEIALAVIAGGLALYALRRDRKAPPQEGVLRRVSLEEHHHSWLLRSLGRLTKRFAP